MAIVLASAFFVTPEGSTPATQDPAARVLSRVTELVGNAAVFCGFYHTFAGEKCLVDAFQARRVAVANSEFETSNSKVSEASVVTSSGALLTIRASTDKSELVEARCGQPEIVVEFGQRRLRCSDSYVPPMGATMLSEPPVRLLPSDSQPKLLKYSDVPVSVCSTPIKLIIAELLIERTGRISEARVVLLPPSCDEGKLLSILKRWRYEPPIKNGKRVSIIQTITISFEASE